MLLALGAASAALDAFKSLTAPQSSSSQPIGSGPTASPFDISAPPSGGSTAVTGSTGGAQISPATLNALLAAQSQSSAGAVAPATTGRGSALQNLFSQIDANGDGQITKSEFENALGAGGTNIAQADQVFSQLDRNGDGTVSLGELSSALHSSGSHGHHHHAHIGGSGGSGAGTNQGGSGGSSGDPLLQALQGASTTSVTNSDGSTTTSLTYADGSKVTLTSPVPTTASSAASSSYNIVEQLIQREAKAVSLATTPLSVSA
ncbi:MAG TPA: EF-hand domain-containing protein [Bradyrhizobium sp.]|nr:EF-hand domain-containing protein [Bradyrhizobium sp.]